MSFSIKSADLRIELQDLYDDYSASLDEVDLVRWSGFFSDDCTYQVISRENYDGGLTHAQIWCDGIGMVQDRAGAILETAVYEPRWLRHFVSGIRILSSDEREIQLEANFMISEALLDKEPHVAMVGRYVDTVVRKADRLVFKKRLCVFDNYRVRTTLVFPV